MYEMMPKLTCLLSICIVDFADHDQSIFHLLPKCTHKSHFRSMQELLYDCQKLIEKAVAVSFKKPWQTVKKLYHTKELEDKIKEIKEDILKAQTEFQVRCLSYF